MAAETGSLAVRLAAARVTGGTVTPFAGEGPRDTEGAYRLQDEIASALGPVSEAWKVGSTSREAQIKLGTTEPASARIPARYRCHSGGSLAVYAAHDLWVEGEFALRLGTELPPRAAAYDRAEVIAAIDGVAPALEIVGCRLSSGIAGAGRFLITADGGANVGFVTGPVIEDWQAFDLPSHRLVVRCNDIKVAEGSGVRALGDPVNVLVWLANHQRRRTGIPAGAMVSTGTCTGLVRIAPGDRLLGDFGTIGAVEIHLTSAADS